MQHTQRGILTGIITCSKQPHVEVQPLHSVSYTVTEIYFYSHHEGLTPLIRNNSIQAPPTRQDTQNLQETFLKSKDLEDYASELKKKKHLYHKTITTSLGVIADISNTQRHNEETKKNAPNKRK